jgi:hypothetical protein
MFETLFVELEARSGGMFENKVLRRIFGPQRKERTYGQFETIM